MKTVEIAEATEPLSEYARRVKDEAVVVTLRGKPVATLMAVPKGAYWESLAIGSHPRFLDLMERSRIAHREHGGVSPDEMRRHFSLKPRPESSKESKRR
jgi:antitoxin (DNA-binding transcriptional repressor) of toxin-antitoxin stability system